MANRKEAVRFGGRTSRETADGRSGRLGRILVSLALGLVVLVFLAAIGFLVLQIVGKNRLYSSASGEELLVNLADITVSYGGSVEDGGDGWQVGDVRYEGVHYRYNPDILTFLFLGIDKMGEVEPVKDGIDGGQSDAIFLLALNPHNKKATVIGIPRDTMTEVEVYSRTGAYLGIVTAQLCLQHGYGDGAQVSCERSRDAVSKLFYGLPIHGYCAINMGAIPLLNDAIGGIDLTAMETMDFDGFHVREGEELHLEGTDAYHYLHDRDTRSAGSAGRRLERQRQYLTAYAVAAVAALKEDIALPVNLYGTLSRYMVTDITVDEVGYLATQVIGYSFEDMCMLEGEIDMGERFEEFYLDEEALYRLILDVFYEEVE